MISCLGVLSSCYNVLRGCGQADFRQRRKRDPLRRVQATLWHKGLAKDIEYLWQPWMKEADRLLDDAALLESVYEAQGQRYPHSRTLGRLQTHAEAALRLLILKHVCNWGYDMLEREVRANLVYRAFTRIGDGKVPDAILQGFARLLRFGSLLGLYDLLGPVVSYYCRRQGVPYVIESMGMYRPIDRSFRLKHCGTTALDARTGAARGR